jgi:hypothetical protein
MGCTPHKDLGTIKDFNLRKDATAAASRVPILQISNLFFVTFQDAFYFL